MSAWIEIEDGCEMPEVEDLVLIITKEPEMRLATMGGHKDTFWEHLHSGSWDVCDVERWRHIEPQESGMGDEQVVRNWGWTLVPMKRRDNSDYFNVLHIMNDWSTVEATGETAAEALAQAVKKINTIRANMVGGSLLNSQPAPATEEDGATQPPVLPKEKQRQELG